MPDVREVIEMTTKQIEPDVDAWREQERRQRRSSRGRKGGAIAVAAAIGLGVAVFALANQGGPDQEVATSPTPAVADTPSVSYTLDVVTGEMTPMPGELLGGAVFSASADGTLVAYSWCCGSPNPAFVANVDGTGLREITPDGVDGFGPALSPDGSTLVYQRREGNSQELGNLVVMDLATGEETQVTDIAPAEYGLWFMNPSFSPDGERIVFHLPRGPADDVRTRWDVWSVPAGGGELTLEVADASMGSYGPDGRLVYVDQPRGSWGGASADGVGRLVIRELDGTSTPLVEARGEIVFPRWSPDGTTIVYQGGPVGGSGGIYLVPATGGEPTVVGRGEHPAWLDDDTLIIVR